MHSTKPLNLSSADRIIHQRLSLLQQEKGDYGITRLEELLASGASNWDIHFELNLSIFVVTQLRQNIEAFLRFKRGMNQQPIAGSSYQYLKLVG
jgi:hypothetical protein